MRLALWRATILVLIAAPSWGQHVLSLQRPPAATAAGGADLHEDAISRFERVVNENRAVIDPSCQQALDKAIADERVARYRDLVPANCNAPQAVLEGARTVVSSRTRLERSASPKLVPLKVSADLLTRREEFDAGAYVLPSLTGALQQNLFGQGGLEGDLFLQVQFQPPARGDSDVSEIAKRIALVGGLGSLSIGFHLSYANKDETAGAMMGVNAYGSWQSSVSVKTPADPTKAVSTSAFAFLNSAGGGGAWWGPIYVGGQFAYGVASKSKDNPLRDQVNGKVNGQLEIVLALDFIGGSGGPVSASATKFLQFRAIDADHIELRFVTAFTPL